MKGPDILAKGRATALFVPPDDGRHPTMAPTSWERPVTWELLATSPVEMVVVSEPGKWWPLVPLSWLATYASNGEPWVLAETRKGEIRVLIEHHHLTTILEGIGHTAGLRIAPLDQHVEISIGVPSMTRITASNGGDFEPADFPDHEFFPVTLLEAERIESTTFKKNKAPDAPKEWRIKTKWVTEDDAENWLWVYASTSIGESKGTVSTLRQIINAIHGRKAAEPIAWFDDETLEYCLDGDVTSPPTGTLAPGLRVAVSGETKPKKQTDGSMRDMFKVNFFRPAEATTVEQAAPAKAKTAPAAVPVPAPAPAHGVERVVAGVAAAAGDPLDF